jgi:hypothetical protein
MQGLAGLRQLDLHRPPVGRVAPPLDESRPLERVEMAGQRRPLDAERTCEFLLRPPLLAPQAGQDQPLRQGAACLRQGRVERAADCLRRGGEVQSDRRPVLTILDATIVNVALATLGREFGAAIPTIQWVATAYLLAFASVIR